MPEEVLVHIGCITLGVIRSKPYILIQIKRRHLRNIQLLCESALNERLIHRLHGAAGGKPQYDSGLDSDSFNQEMADIISDGSGVAKYLEHDPGSFSCNGQAAVTIGRGKPKIVARAVRKGR